MSWMSWHHLISKQTPHGSTQIIKVIGFNFQSLLMSELNASKNKIVFVLEKFITYQDFLSAICILYVTSKINVEECHPKF